MTCTSNTDGFGTVVDDTLLEPGMLESFLRGNTFVGIINEDLLEKVEEELIELTCVGMTGNDILWR